MSNLPQFDIVSPIESFSPKINVKPASSSIPDIDSSIKEISFKDFNVKRMLSSRFENKAYKSNNVKYSEIRLSYNFANGGVVKSDSLIIEGPVFKCKRGVIVSEFNQNNPNNQNNSQNNVQPMVQKKEYQVLLDFDMSNPEHVQFKDTLDVLYNYVCEKLYENREYISGGKYEKFTLDSFSSLVKKLYNVSKKVAGQMGMFVPLYKSMYSNKPNDKTVFISVASDLDNGIRRDFEWSEVQDCEIEIIPLIRFPRIYIDSKGSMLTKYELLSALVIAREDISSIARQQDTLRRFQMANRETVDMLIKQYDDEKSKMKSIKHTEISGSTIEPQSVDIATMSTMDDIQATVKYE